MTRSRRIWPLAMVLPMMVILGGCPEAGPAGRALFQVGKSAKQFVRTGDGLAQNARPLSEAASNLAATPTPTPGQYSPEVRQALEGISTADNEVESQYRKLLVDALCGGMDQLGQAEQESRAEQQEWKSYMLAHFDQFGDNEITNYAHDYAEEKIDQFLTGMNLASVSPRAAQAYAENCVRASP